MIYLRKEEYRTCFKLLRIWIYLEKYLITSHASAPPRDARPQLNLGQHHGEKILKN